ncbi:MAG: glycosyltransferase family 4 protein [Gammaproteobacteria bacterium]
MNPKPHILHVETGRHLFGGAAQVLNLIDGLAERGVRNTLVCAAGGEVEAAAVERGLDVRPLRAGGDFDGMFGWRLSRVIRELRPSIVHVHSRRGADRFGGQAALLAGVPAVLSRRVDSRESMFGGFKYGFYEYVIAISDCIRRQLLDVGVPAGKIRLVPSGVSAAPTDAGWTRDRYLAEFGLGEDDLVVFMIAQLIPRKGHAYLLDAWSRIRSDCPNARTLLFGTGALESKLRAVVASRGLKDVVRFAGFRPDLADFIGHADLVVHPAIREGLGVSLLQAQAAGVPVVGFAAGGVEEAVDDGVTGTLVPPRDADALADAIIQLAENPEERERMGAAARSWVEEKFNIDNMIEGNLHVYLEVLDAQPEGPEET